MRAVVLLLVGIAAVLAIRLEVDALIAERQLHDAAEKVADDVATARARMTEAWLVYQAQLRALEPKPAPKPSLCVYPACVSPERN